MIRLFAVLFSMSFIICTLVAQAKVDLDRSVPVWMEYDESNNEAVLKWIADENATNYFVSATNAFLTLTPLATLEGSATEFDLGQLNTGELYQYHIRKDGLGRGIINVGIELDAKHTRGRCLIVIEDILPIPLEVEIEQLVEDITMDGWSVDTIHVSALDAVVEVKSKIRNWHDSDYDLSQSLFLLGHVPVPYSGNSAHDGHGDHQGAWPADLFYGELDGNWTDIFVDNATPSRDKNDNVPGDGKYDQTSNPSILELEVGRVDFSDLPAFSEDEIELTRKYLIKNHAFKTGMKDYPRRAIVENNFGSFAEGFGQSAWRNFPSMFGGDSVRVGNYDVMLESEKYLCSYACGGGSYTSASGVGNTSNLWASKEINTVFTMVFGSYFGDWDSQNNFLRGALGSGDILTNAWSGRPIWQLYEMSLGDHIGKSTKLSQDAAGSYFQNGNSGKSAHIALMGDPTLRLHPMKRPANVSASFDNGDIHLVWDESQDATHGYFVYRRMAGQEWVLMATVDSMAYDDYCVDGNTDFEYMVKARKLELSGSGSYYNTSLGITTSITTGDNPLQMEYFADADMDGYGNPDASLISCVVPPGHSENNEDCDDTNADINPNGIEIPNNGIDEDCDGIDLLVDVDEMYIPVVKVYPNPTSGILNIDFDGLSNYQYTLQNALGKQIQKGMLGNSLDLSKFEPGFYWLSINDVKNESGIVKLIVLSP